jgi:hypothetical protein
LGNAISGAEDMKMDDSNVNKRKKGADGKVQEV